MKKGSRVKMPIDAVVATTYRCNSRCIMCDIWKIKDFPELPPRTFKKLPPSLKEINISGGEPFLRRDISEIIRVVHDTCPKARIIISSNGFLVRRIKEEMPRILKIDPNIGINISVDGYGEMHEKVRRIPHAWEKDVEVLEYCKSIGVKSVGLAFTLNNENYKHARKLFDYAQKNGYKFSMAVAQSSEHYFGAVGYKTKVPQGAVEKEFKYLVKKLLKSRNLKDWARAYFVNGLFNIATGKKPPLPAGGAGSDFFYLDPKGDVYPSVADSIIMGNINDVDHFEELWYSAEADKARDELAGYEEDYWYVCTARPAMKRNPLKVARWIFERKIKKDSDV